ncbi:hypothetical protein N9933_02785, partial [bacterium]|nr:hypothetical protein [bacterium]
MNRLLPFLLLSLLIFAACSSGRKSLEQGDYNASVLKSINRLRQSPNNKKAKETLQGAYPRLLAYNKDAIKRLKTGSDPFRWERVKDLYAELNNVYD